MNKAPYILVLFSFLLNTLGPLPLVQAQDFQLPVPGVMVHLSPEFDPPILKGIKVHPDDPFLFDFILDQGDEHASDLKNESTRLIKYFFASLTIPEKDLWVNLSPYEKDRIIPQSFGLTEMGRDLLAEDYMLKQITASLIYPEGEVGRKFWKRVYEEATKKYGTANIPVNTFNKVWIVPEKAVVYENAKAGTAYIVESKLKVMLEQDYLALEKHTVMHNGMASVGADIVREIVIPELTKEVNENKNFSQLRQVYNSLILATWYKKKIKDSLLERVYEDKNKIAGVGYKNSTNIEAIYQRYLKAFKKGVYNYIKEESDPMTQETVPRKYFSGGVSYTKLTTTPGVLTEAEIDRDENGRNFAMITADAASVSSPKDRAMTFVELKEIWNNPSPHRLRTEILLKAAKVFYDQKQWVLAITWARQAYEVARTPGRDSVPINFILQAQDIIGNARKQIEHQVHRSTVLKSTSGRPIVLIVEDDPRNQIVLSQRMQDSPLGGIFEFRMVSSVRSARDILKKKAKDVAIVITDTVLTASDAKGGSIKNGDALVQTLWTNKFYKGIPVLAVTGDLNEAKEIYQEAGIPTVLSAAEENMPRKLPKKGEVLLLDKFLLITNLESMVMRYARKVDSAQLAQRSSAIARSDTASSRVRREGGIDFTANKTPLEVRNNGASIRFHLDPAMFQQLQNTSGFMPVIIKIQPMTDLRQFLGLNVHG